MAKKKAKTAGKPGTHKRARLVTVRDVGIAAKMYGWGLSWVAIGKEVGKSARTVEDWPRMHPELWNAPFNEARENRWQQLEREITSLIPLAVKTAGELIKSGTKADSVREAMVHSVLTIATRLRPQKVEHSGELQVQNFTAWVDGMARGAADARQRQADESVQAGTRPEPPTPGTEVH